MTMVIRPSPLQAASEICKERFSEAKAIFLAGSALRGEQTPYSDLDLVVVYETLATAWRQSFIHNGWPVEAFVHDPETLTYFFWEMDRPSGVPSLAAMVMEGKEIPAEDNFSRSIKTLAQVVLQAGPPDWTEKDFQRARYQITDSCDDIRAPRSPAELTASLTYLYQQLADFCFRSQGRWSAKNKGIPRRLAEVDPLLTRRFVEAFDAGFFHQTSSLVLELAETILTPYGGFLFDNYRSDAPASYRKRPPRSDQE
jgi:hypothetical protein